MKKLALALVCLVSVAFFASCDPKVENPEPSVNFLMSEGYISSDAELLTTDTAWFCIQANSNLETKKLLKSFNFLVFSEETRLYDTLIQDINRDSYEFVTGFQFSTPGSYTVTGTVIDVDGFSAECRVNITVENSLQPALINWVRTGANVEEQAKEQLESVGLEWTGSHKEIFATIKALDGVQLWICDGNDFADLLSSQHMANYYNSLFETVPSVAEYRNITTAHSADYNDMLFTKTADGNYHAVLISHAGIETGSYGTKITITGAMK